MMEMITELLKTAFFLQGSYAFTYVPIMIIVMTIALHRYSSLSWITSILTVLQCVLASYVCILMLSGIVALALTYLQWPLVSYGLKRPLHYSIAIGLSAVMYALVQIAFLSVQRKNSGINRLLLVIICNAITVGIMIGLNVFLFIRHL